MIEISSSPQHFVGLVNLDRLKIVNLLLSFSSMQKKALFSKPSQSEGS